MADQYIYRLYHATDAGKDGYPLAWHETIKHAVREQAGHRCIRCKHPYRNGEHGRGEWSPCDRLCEHDDKDGCCHALYRPGEAGGAIRPDQATDIKVFREWAFDHGMIVESAWRILTVHHLDEVKLNCRWWNLAALCQRCHLTIQGRVKMHRPYFLEHSEWMKPYVAGFYALVHLKEELTREQVMGRLDELLALASREAVA